MEVKSVVALEEGEPQGEGKMGTPGDAGPFLSASGAGSPRLRKVTQLHTSSMSGGQLQGTEGSQNVAR